MIILISPFEIDVKLKDDAGSVCNVLGFVFNIGVECDDLEA